MKLRVTNVSLVNGGRYTVNLSEAREGGENVPASPMGMNGMTSLSLNLPEDEARAYFPGDEYTITLKKA